MLQITLPTHVHARLADYARLLRIDRRHAPIGLSRDAILMRDMRARAHVRDERSANVQVAVPPLARVAEIELEP